MLINHIRHEYLPGPQATTLHTLDIWLPRLSSNDSRDTKWVVYIHGGAWRDPTVDAMTLRPAMEILSSNSSLSTSISGFASINYRLSSYLGHPTNPSTPNDPSRNAKHPDHLVDVSKALRFLEEKYAISNGYLLVGHSAGATLAFQVLERKYDSKVPRPLGVLGIEGIYALKDLTTSFERIPVYKEFVVNAFGPNESVWEEASPYSAKKPALWEKAKAIMIAHSDDDELIDTKQAELMCRRVRETPDCQKKLHYLPATGLHDQIWEEGHELARLIEQALALV